MIDLTTPLDGNATLIIDPYPLADSVNFQLRKGDVPLRVAETWLSRTIGADVKLQHHHGDRFTAWVNGIQERETVEVKLHKRRSRMREEEGRPMEIVIPTMDWEQIGGDMDPGAYGGTIATGDGHALELKKIQPVREYVGDEEAAEVGFPFWTREAYFDADDLNPSNKEVRSAMSFVGLDEDALAEMSPTQRAVALADAMLDYGHADEGPAGWSKDIGIPEKVKWSTGKIAGAEYIADEDDAFRDEVLGYGEIKTALEEVVSEMVDQSAAEGWSHVDDQLAMDLEGEGFDPESIIIETNFGDAIAVNEDLLVGPHWAKILGVKANELWSEVGTDKLTDWLDANGYEYLDRKGGRVPTTEGYAYAEHVIRAVADRLDEDHEKVEEAARSLDWWQEEIPGSSSGSTYVWARRK